MLSSSSGIRTTDIFDCCFFVDVAAQIAAFDGSGSIHIGHAETRITHTNDVSLRFKTHRPNGLLFVTSNRRNDGYLKLSLHNGRGVVETNIDGQAQVGRRLWNFFPNFLKACLQDER
jgi:hypothetical protein